MYLKQKTAYDVRISNWSSTCALPISKQCAEIATPKLRFPAFVSERWDRAPGDKLFDQTNTRDAEAGLPILAITQEHGAIPRDLIDYHVSVTEKSIESSRSLSGEISS